MTSFTVVKKGQDINFESKFESLEDAKQYLAKEMNYKVKFSYEDTVSEEVIINSSESEKRLLNRLLKSNPDVAEITILSQTK